jgi:hypothetical protein
MNIGDSRLKLGKPHLGLATRIRFGVTAKRRWELASRFVPSDIQLSKARLRFSCREEELRVR